MSNSLIAEASRLTWAAMTPEERRAKLRPAQQARSAAAAARRTDPEAAARWIETQIAKAPPLNRAQRERIAGLLLAGIDR